MVSSDYENIYTITDWYDGARAGVADFNGQPHYYECLFDESLGYTSTYLLHPIDAETLRLALEDWEIWERWDAARKEGRVDLETHPALPEDRARHDEIEAMLKKKLVIDPACDVKAEADFRGLGSEDQSKSKAIMKVQWSVIP
jgi:hypothetical protein